MLFDRHHGLVGSGAWLVVLDFGVFAVRHLRLEHAVVSVRVEVLSILDLVVVVSGAWVHFLVDGGLEGLSFYFHRFKIDLR